MRTSICSTPRWRFIRAGKTPLTIDGVHLSEEGDRQLAEVIAKALLGKPVSARRRLEPLRAAVLDKDLHWYNRYRASDGNDIWGGRSTLAFINGQTNAVVLQHELSMLDVMTANRDVRIWAAPQGKDAPVDDSNMPKPVPVDNATSAAKGKELQRREGRHRSNYISGEEGHQADGRRQGVQVNLFADEKKFPQLVNPVQMQVDAKGRLWAAVWPTYPTWEPRKPMNDAILVFHDDDGNGKANRVTEFAKVQNPLGFEFWNGGVIVTCMLGTALPQGHQGRRTWPTCASCLLQGLDTADTHHGANNLIYGPDGGDLLAERRLHAAQLRAPWGPSLQPARAGMYRFDPRRFTISFHAANGPNSHGIAFDYWGNQYATDGTSGNAFQVRPNGNGFKMPSLLNKEVRPVTGVRGRFQRATFPSRCRAIS